MQWNFPPIKQRKEPTIHSIDASTRPTPVQQVKFKRKLFNRCRALNRIAYVSGTKTYYPKCYSLQKVRVNEYHNMVPGIFNKILRCYSDVRMPCLVHSTGFLCSAPNKGQWSTFCELYGSHGLTDVFGWSTGVRFFFYSSILLVVAGKFPSSALSIKIPYLQQPLNFTVPRSPL